MSELKLNLVDSQKVLCGKIHASIADRAVAALTAEPETIEELKLALTRYEKEARDYDLFSCFRESHQVDEESWDAGLMIIDLSARLVAIESTYSCPSAEGDIHFHDGECASEIVIPYQLSSDWKFVYSLDQYIFTHREPVAARAAIPPFDARRVFYGEPLFKFIADQVLLLSAETKASSRLGQSSENWQAVVDCRADNDWPSQIHAKWLSTPREDLLQQTPRDILLARQDYIDFDMHTRELQWSFLHEGPPCLPLDSNAYRFAGFGTHEWVIYYDLVRHLICSAFTLLNSSLEEAAEAITREFSDRPVAPDESGGANVSSMIVTKLAQIQTTWLETPNKDYDDRTPANLIESERKRLPIAMSPRDMVVSDDCPICRMMANDMELAHEVGFWHLDGSHMDEGFVFSPFVTLAEWEADRLRWEEFHENFAREQAERKAREKERFLTAEASG